MRKAEAMHRTRRGRPAGGYALLILMMMVTLLLVALTAAMPSIYMEAQREREEELIFRGNEYARAIAFFHKQFNRYPTSVDELLKKTNGVRFLRRAYTDPMSKNGKWRFIHSNPQGVLIDSLTQASAAVPGTGAGALPGVGTGAAPGAGFGPTIGTAGGGTLGGGTLGGTPGTSPQDLTKKLAEQARKACDQAGQSSGSSGGGSQFGGGGTYIAGVASCSQKESVRIWNSKTHYDEWEFLASAVSPGGTALPGAKPGAQPGAPGTPGAAGTGTGAAGGSSAQPPGPPPQAAPPEIPPLTDQPEQPEEPPEPQP